MAALISKIDLFSVLIGFVLCLIVLIVIDWIDNHLHPNDDDEDDDDRKFENELRFASTGGQYPRGFSLAGMSDKKLVAWCRLVLADELTGETAKAEGIGRHRFEHARETWVANGWLDRSPDGTVHPPTGKRGSIAQVMEQANKRILARSGGVVLKPRKP